MPYSTNNSQPTLDERFHTPRASASSSRSNNSASSSVYGTPRSRSSMMSARSQSSMMSTDSNDLYCTPRSSPYPPAYGRRSGGHRDVGHDRDRSRDLRRFADRGSLSNRGAPMSDIVGVDRGSLSHKPDSIVGYNNDLSSQRSAQRQQDYYVRTSSIQPPRSAQRQQDYYVRAESKAIVPKQEEPNNIKIISLARHGRVGEVEEMLVRGVPVDTVDDNGNTLVHVACQNGSKKIARVALRFGADINAVNHAGNTPLYFAMKYGFGNTLGQWLIGKGARQP